MEVQILAEQITVFISRATEATAAIIIGVALCKVVVKNVASFFLIKSVRNAAHASSSRRGFAVSVSLALELLLGADVLATAVAPSWDDIGKLAAIAIIRTTLNYFLDKELKMQQSGPGRQQDDSVVKQ